MDLRFSPAWVNVGQHAFFENHFLILNTKRTPLDDPSVRAAIAGAIDKTALLRVCQCEGCPAEHILPVAWPTPPDTLMPVICGEAEAGTSSEQTLIQQIVALAQEAASREIPIDTVGVPQADSLYWEVASWDSSAGVPPEPAQVEGLAEDAVRAAQPSRQEIQADSAADTTIDQDEAASARARVRAPQPAGEEEAAREKEELAEYILIVRENRDIGGRIAAAIRPVLEELGFAAEIVPLAPEAFRLAQRDDLYDFCLDVALPRFRDAALSYQAFLAEHEGGQFALQQFQSDLFGTLAQLEAHLERIPLLHLNTYFLHAPHIRGIASLPSGQLWVADAWLERCD